jgi:hypothetical protein
MSEEGLRHSGKSLDSFAQQRDSGRCELSRFDAHLVQDGSKKIGRRTGLVGRIGAVRVALANDVRRLEAASGDEGRVTTFPVVASGFSIDFWRATEFSNGDHNGFIQEATVV